MEISAALAADLTTLTTALDDPGIDLEALLRHLSDTCSFAVETYLGFSMRLIVDDYPLSLTVLEDFLDYAEIGASAMIPLGALGKFGEGGDIIFYAGNSGAFVDLAADLSFALGLASDVVKLDHHLVPPVQADGVAGLREMSLHNQALGILIDRGHPADEATDMLHRMARRNGVTPVVAAQQVLDSAIFPSSDGPR